MTRLNEHLASQECLPLARLSRTCQGLLNVRDVLNRILSL